MPAFPWILADLESFIGAVFMLIAFVGWIVNLANQNKPGMPPQRKNIPPRPQQDPKTVQSEIEKFLTQAQQNAPAEANRAGGPEARRRDRIEPPRPQPPGSQPPRNPPVRRPPPAERRRRTQKDIWEEQVGKAPQQTAPVRPASPPRQMPRSPSQRRPSETSARNSAPPTPTLPARPVAPNLPQRGPLQRGNGLGSSLISSGTVGRELGAPIGTQGSSHFGAFLGRTAKSFREQAGTNTDSRRETPASRVAVMLQSRQSVQEAILLGEILAKPRVLRR